MQFYELGDLDACVKNPLPEDEARQISSQVTRAIRFMHDQDFTHRDIKPSVREKSVCLQEIIYLRAGHTEHPCGVESAQLVDQSGRFWNLQACSSKRARFIHSSYG